jgi:hypothetical protein
VEAIKRKERKGGKGRKEGRKEGRKAIEDRNPKKA